MSQSQKGLYEFGDFRLDAAERLLSHRGVSVPLTPKAVDLLLALVAQPGRLLDKDTLLATVWPDSFVEENNLADNIFKLRRALGDRESGPRFIETVPKRGYRFVADVRAIEHMTAEPPKLEQGAVSERLDGQVPIPVTHTRSSVRVPWLVSGAMTLLVFALAFGYGRRGSPEPPGLLTAEVLPPANASFADIAVSPDGQWLAATVATGSRVQLWLRSMADGNARLLESTDGASHPFWSPDSRFVGFFAGGKLKKVELGVGLPVSLCQASVGTGGTWSREGVILFSVLGAPQISRVSAQGGVPDVVLRAAPGETDLHEPFFLPDGRRFLYLAISGKKEAAGIYVGSLDGTLRQRILEHDSNAVFIPGDANHRQRGYLLFGREGGLMALAFDADALRTNGEAVPIAPRLGTVQGANLSYRRRNFTASDNGLLIYDAHADRQRSQLLWVNRRGAPLHPLVQLDNVGTPSLAPDETRIVVARKDLASNNNDLWLTDPLGNNPVRFTFDPGSDLLGLWSFPDGRRIVWTSTRNGSFDLYVKELSRDGTDTLLLHSEQPTFPMDWSRDGRFLLYRQISPRTSHDIFVLPTSGDRTPFPYLQTPAMENSGAFSPDGKWIAYSSDESGLVEVYVETFPTHGGKRQISLAGGSGPRWRADGAELYFYSLDGKLMAVPVIGDGASLTTGTPVMLFPFRPAAAMTGPSYTVARDGQRFLLSTVVDTDAKAPLAVVQNWTAVIAREHGKH